MDKVKSFLKGEDSSSSKHHSSSTGSSSTGNTAREAARDVESAASGHGHHSAAAGTTASSAARTGGAVAETYETQDQTLAPMVEHDTVQRLREEQVQQVVDKDINVDHYHTTVQPLVDREVAPTVHREQQAQTQYQEIDRDDAARTKAALEAEAAKYQNTRTDLGTEKTTTNLGTVEHESVHHHLHETIQPVLEKEIVQKEVVHTTIPIKEVIHEQSHIHDTSVAAPVSVAEFEKMQAQATQGSATQGSATQGTNY